MTRFLLLIFYFTLSLHFTPGLQTAVCILPSVCILPPVCSLRFTLTGFVVWKTPNLKRLSLCCEYKYLQVSKQAFEFTIVLKLQTIAVVISFISGKKNRKGENYGVIAKYIVVGRQYLPENSIKTV